MRRLAAVVVRRMHLEMGMTALNRCDRKSKAKQCLEVKKKKSAKT